MTKPLRQLGLTVTAAIVVANMIGTGVFTSTGFQAASLHDPGTILLCWVIGGVVALCGAATYAESVRRASIPVGQETPVPPRPQ